MSRPNATGDCYDFKNVGKVLVRVGFAARLKR